MSARRLERTGRNIALISGLVLFVLAAIELCIYAVGLVSLQTMGDLAAWQSAFTHSWLGTALIFCACVGHIVATLWFTARRATLRMSRDDAALIASGILVPVLLLPYVVDTRLANILFGVNDDILYRLAKLWPEHDLLYVSLIVLIWGHGCVGLHGWLSQRAGYRKIAPILAVVALAIPIAAISGLIASARIVATLVADNTFAEQVRTATHWPTAEMEYTLRRLRLIALASYGGLLLAAAGALIARFLKIVVAPKIDVTYVNGPKLKASTGPTLLEISRLNAVPHANGCGGRGRCTACSVRIEQGEGTLPPRTAAEVELLDGQDDRVRLACQIKPTAALTVTRLTPTAETVSDAAAEPELDTGGIERQVAAFSVHLQGYATLVGSRRAYDAIFFLNEFLDTVSACVVKHKGTIVQTTGRGIVALFDQADSAQAACRAGFAAGADINIALDRLNERFSAEFGQPIAVAMGLAFGTAYLGRIGAGPSKPFTAVGPVVDAAEDLAAFAESRRCQLVAVPAAVHAAGIDSNGMELVPFTPPNGDTYEVFTTDHARLVAFA